METSSYTVELSQEEVLALSSEMASIQEWLSNIIHERARITIESITSNYIKTALQEKWSIPQTQFGILQAAFEKGIVKNLVQT